MQIAPARNPTPSTRCPLRFTVGEKPAGQDFTPHRLLAQDCARTQTRWKDPVLPNDQRCGQRSLRSSLSSCFVLPSPQDLHDDHSPIQIIEFRCSNHFHGHWGIKPST
ncbi:hypothetical protein AOLI_G00294450 [Acnodon oligacanthus]